MPKRWKIAAEVTMTETDEASDDRYGKEKEYTDEGKARAAFERLKRKIGEELESED